MRREERGERREERRERREERREEIGERREERGERRGERRERRKERGGERGERDDPGPTSPKWFRPWVSLSLHVRVTCLHSGSWLLSGWDYKDFVKAISGLYWGYIVLEAKGFKVSGS